MKGLKTRKEIKTDLFFYVAPPIIQSCSTTSSFKEVTVRKTIKVVKR